MMTDSCNKLMNSWNLFYHLPQDKNWNLSSHKCIMKEIDDVDKLITITNSLHENVVKYSMLFFMKDGINPMWEDKQNRNGGCFSYKVINKNVPSVWSELMYCVGGNTITINKKDMNLINGITISPKKSFCIIKIWISNCTLQNHNTIYPIENLTKMGCIFKEHEHEF